MNFEIANCLIPGWIVDQFPKFLAYLLDAAARSLAVASVAALVLLLARTKNLTLRLSVWKAVVCAALAMPFLAVSMPRLPVSLPLLDRLEAMFASAAKSDVPRLAVENQPPYQPPSGVALQASSLETRRPAHKVNAVRLAASSSKSHKLPWLVFISALYVAVASILAFRFVIGWFLSQRLKNSSHAIRDSNVVERFESHRHTTHLRFAPRLAESDRIAVPLTCGVLRPAVLFPADWREWDTDTLDAVIAHEMSHVARRDALTERLALIHRSIFWFSPLAWWLPRCLADLAEEASDNAALAAGTEPARYAEILLGFLQALNSVSRRAEWQGAAMAQSGRAEKRLDRILNGGTAMTSSVKKSLAAIVVLSSVPVILVAASLQPGHLGNQIVLTSYPSRPAVPARQAVQSSAAVPAVPVTSAVAAPRAMPNVTAAVASAQVSAQPAPRALPMVVSVQAQAAPPAPVSPASPRAVAPPAPPTRGVVVMPPGRYSYLVSGDSKDSYAIISGNSQTISGSFGNTDLSQVEALREKLKTDFIWFERDGKSYTVTDPKLVSRAKQAFAKQAELGEKEGELGEKLGALGELQGQLGEQQGIIGAQIGEMYSDVQNINIQIAEIPNMKEEIAGLQEQAQELAKSAAAQFNSEAFRQSMEKMQKNLADAQKAFEESRRNMDAQVRSNVSRSVDSAATEAARQQAREALDAQMSKLGAQQESLARQQEKLSQQQDELAREQEEASAKASDEMKSVLDEAIAHGAAQPAPRP